MRLLQNLSGPFVATQGCVEPPGASGFDVCKGPLIVRPVVEGAAVPGAVRAVCNFGEVKLGDRLAEGVLKLARSNRLHRPAGVSVVQDG